MKLNKYIKENKKLLILVVLTIVIYFTFPSALLIFIVFLNIYFINNTKTEKIQQHEIKTDKVEIFNFEKTIPFPYAIVQDKKIVFASDKFKEKFDFNLNKNITETIKEYEVGVRRQNVTILEKYYTLYSTLVNYKGNSELIYFVELSYEIPQEFNNVEPIIVSLVFIDNFEEVIETVEEIRRPLLIALIDRKLNTLSQQVGGIVKKFEKDKYIFIFTQDKLNYLKDRKFDILDQIREIDMGNKMPVTLSMGIGISKNNLSQSMEYARVAIDLALGRGGDQVLIKDSLHYIFFGGKAKEVGNNTRVRARVKAYALSELIEEASDVIIMGHRNTDLDCLGSGVGVHTIVKESGKNSKIVLNNITTNVFVLYERLMKEKDYKTNVFISSEKALEIINEGTLLIIVDSHRPSIMECPELLLKASKIVVFDHHRKSTEFVDSPVLTYHEPYASSTAELITEMLLYTKNEVKLLPVEADALLSGITLDTKNFAFKTGAKTFEAAAYLRRNGADSIRVKMLFQNNMDSYKAKATTVNSAKMFNDNMAISVCPKDIENPSLIAAQAADELLNIYGVVASFVLCEEEDKIIISARSLGSVNVQVIMEKLGGGGHQTVSGAQLFNITLEESVEKLKEAINKYIQEATK